MDLLKIWLCTSKNSNLYRIYLLQTGDTERRDIYDCIYEDLNKKLTEEQSMDELNGNALIDDIPYYISFEDIQVDSYLYSFKEKVEEILDENSLRVIQFSKNPLNIGDIVNFEDSEGIKFIIAQSDKNLYFLYANSNSIIKNRLVMSLSISENSTILKVPKGIQIPPGVTAKYNCVEKKLYVYDVNRFESMLTLK